MTGGHRLPRRLRLRAERIDAPVDAETTYRTLFAGSPQSFWLDSSLVTAGSRFSFLGAPDGPLGATKTYDVGRRELTTRSALGVEIARVDLFDHLREHVLVDELDAPPLPFAFCLGHVGYLGYEVKAQTGGARVHSSTHPDAAFVVADRAVAVDHRDGGAWVLALTTEVRGPNDDWVERVADRLGDGVAAAEPGDPCGIGGRDELATPAPFTRRHSDEEYLRLVARCQELIRDGESYEICLTNAWSAAVEVDPLLLHRLLRRRSPATYGAYLDLGDFQVISSSPERFLRVSAGGDIESKPVKGTRRRGRTPAEDEELRADLASHPKDRAENLMIVDLVRNDVGRVSAPGTVEVPSLFAVETYATVHQLVSTITGRLRPGTSPVTAIEAAFPPGSMTGAPKIRTMEILDALEGGPRGVYSGALGHLGPDGAVDLSVVIRTIVADPGRLSFGVGGAVVALSDPVAELDETVVKAQGMLQAVAAAAPGEGGGTAHGAGTTRSVCSPARLAQEVLDP